MSHFVEGSYQKRKNGKLHIYIRNEKYKNKLKSKNFVGRTYIDGRQKIISSKTSNKTQAIKILENWYDKLQFKKEMGIGIHDSSIKDCLKEYLKSFKDDQSRSKNTLSFFKQKLDAISKCKELMKLPINSLTIDDVNKHFLLWRIENAKKENKILRGATLKGDLTALSSFFNWCFKKGLRQKKNREFKHTIVNKKIETSANTKNSF